MKALGLKMYKELWKMLLKRRKEVVSGLFFLRQGFELRDSHLLSRCSTA
jgi:hypothetical protein